MGRASTQDMIEQVGLSDAVLEWHLFSNHYPPPPRAILPLVKQAIAAYLEGEPERVINTSAVMTHRIHGTQVPAWVILETFHLEDFIAEQTGKGVRI